MLHTSQNWRGSRNAVSLWSSSYLLALFRRTGRYLGGADRLHLDEHVQERRADLLRGVVKAVLERGEKLFQHGVAEGVVQDDGQTLKEDATQSR